MSAELFERATREKLRFQHCGSLSVEDLWDLPVRRLDVIFKSLNAELKRRDESESLLEPATRGDSVLTLQVDILRHIVKTKLAEQEAVQQAEETRKKKQRIMEIMARKEDASLEEMSSEDLAKMLAEL